VILIGNSLRYDENIVEKWLHDRQQASVPATCSGNRKKDLPPEYPLSIAK